MVLIKYKDKNSTSISQKNLTTAEKQFKYVYLTADEIIKYSLYKKN